MQSEIVIIEANSSTRDLVLNPSGTVVVKRGDKVTWSITATNVESFRIEKKESSKEIFALLDKPPKKQTKKGSGRVGLYPKDYTEYEYSIFWIPVHGTKELEYDPKISIMPSTGIILRLILGLISACIGFLTLKFLFGKKRKKKSK